MADNTVLNSGSGGDTIASDDIAGVKHQRVKLSVGADGSAADAVPVSAGMDVTGAAVQAVGLVAQFDNTLTAAVTEDQFAPVRISSRRALLIEGVASGTAVAVDGSAVTQPVSHAALTALNGAISGTEVQVDVVGALPAGTNNIGDVDVLSLPALPAGTNNIGDVDVLTVPADPFGANADAASATGSISAKLRFIAATGIPVTSLPASTNTIEVVGDVAHDAAVAGNPVLVGVEARTSEVTAVANGDATRLQANSVGKLIIQQDAVAGATWSYAAASGGITNTTGVTAAAAAGAGIRRYIKSIQVINGHATVSTDVQIRDGASGTVLHRGFAQAAGGGYTCTFEPPLRGTANTLVEVACGTTGSAVYVNMQGYNSAE